jgi:O-antigen/teichoic acid export membrane protein
MTRSDALTGPRHDLERRSLAHNSLGLVLGKGLQTAAGFLFWVIAARSASVREVGLTAAAASAVMLCTQVAALGAGSAVILAVGRGRPAQPTLDTAFSVVAAAGVPLALGYLLLASALDPDAAAAAASPAVWVVFVVAVVAGTLIIVVDQAHVALGRGATSGLRYALGGLATLAAAGVVAWQGAGGTAALLTCWALGAVVACVAGAVQLRRLIGYRYRPTFRLGRWRSLLGLGVPNQLLTLTERAPGLLLPVLVAHAVSPETAAYWYPAWMMAWAVYSAPVLMGIVQFSEGVRAPEAIGRTSRHSLWWSLGVGTAVAAGLALAATPLLRLLGQEYSDQAAGALRLLVLGLFGYAIVQGYNAVCRARSRLTEAITVNAVLGVLLCAVPLWAADRGVTAMALAWVCVLAAGSLATGARLTALLRQVPRG